MRMAAKHLAMDLLGSRSCICALPWTLKVRRGSALTAPVMRLAHPLLPSNLYKLSLVKGLSPLQHEVDGPADPGCEDAHGLSPTVLLLKSLKELLASGVPAKVEGRSLGEGPLEVGIPHFAAGRLFPLAVGFPTSRDKARVGEEIADLRKAANVLNLVDERQAKDSADAVDRLEELKAGSVVLSDLFDQVELHLMDRVIVGVELRDVGGHRHLYVDVVGEVLEEAVVATVLAIDSLLEGRKVVLSDGVLGVGHELGSPADEVRPSPQEIPCRPHLSWIDVGHGEHASAQQRRDLLRVDAVVLGLSAVDGLHVERMSEREDNVVIDAEVGDPVPAEEALDAHDEISAVGLKDPKEVFRIGPNVLMDLDFAVLGEDADVHVARMQVDPAVVFVLLVVESHLGPPWFLRSRERRAYLNSTRRPSGQPRTRRWEPPVAGEGARSRTASRALSHAAIELVFPVLWAGMRGDMRYAPERQAAASVFGPARGAPTGWMNRGG